MSDASGMYCHACHHQWQREQAGAIECPACRSASTELITPENDPRQFHHRQAPATPASPNPASTASADAGVAPSASQDQEMRDAPADSHSESGNPSGNSATGIGNGPRPQIVFMFPPMTFFTTTIVAPIHAPVPSPNGPTSAPVTHQAPAPNSTPAPAPADGTPAEPRHPPFTLFGMNFIVPQHAPPQESPAPPPPTGTNSPPSGGEMPDTPAPTTTTDTPHPAPTTNAETDGNPPFLPNLGFFNLFIPVPNPQGHHPEGEDPQAAFNHRVAALLRFIITDPVMGDAAYTEQDFERILGHLWEGSQPRGAPPASQAAIDALEVKEVDVEMVGSEGGARCVVCVDDMVVGEKVTSLPCGHFFHGECVVPWLKVHNTCPTCRDAVERDAKMGKGAAFETQPQSSGID